MACLIAEGHQYSDIGFVEISELLAMQDACFDETETFDRVYGVRKQGPFCGIYLYIMYKIQTNTSQFQTACVAEYYHLVAVYFMN